MTERLTFEIPVFDRAFFGSRERFTRIGDGELGGKARGLASIRDFLASELDRRKFPGVEIEIPTSAVITTQFFDLFMARNGLAEIALSDLPDERIAHAFQTADLPTEMLGDLRALINEVHSPLAVRSSSLLEDALFRPFAGVYATKMIPNNQPDPNERFRRLIEAIKYVYASTFFRSAKGYIRATDQKVESEKMAVILQEVVGRRHGERFYPHVSGVARTFNFYPVGRARPEEGVVNLALGLGKTIVDGGISWTYSPAHPSAPPPYGSVGELMKNSQLQFWAVNMGRPPEYNPIEETEYLVQADLGQAEYDGALKHIASTYSSQSDRLTMGIGNPGPRIINFAPLLTLGDMPFNTLLNDLMSLAKKRVDADVEIEFAAILGPSNDTRLGFLQVRPMVVSDERVEIDPDELVGPGLIAASDRSMGNGVIDDICDIVYVKPDVFEARYTTAIAAEIDRINRKLVDEGRRSLLIGFGRWGSSDPWLGIPVTWDQIASAKVIVEATLPTMNVEPSQGSHFFHNMTSFQVSYLSVHHDKRPGIDWDWLSAQTTVTETDHVRHARLERPLRIKVDGARGRAGIWHEAS
jgi:hypothetical protein